MPPLKISKVVSVSSEDPVHVAENLLKGDFSNKKWKGLTPGEKQISLVLQFDQASKISGIDIGNENSAFVEILVSKSSTGSDDYKVLLAATSLMSLKEAKFTTNTNAVKFIKTDDLCETVRNDKWDRVKIVCTQPYNNVVQFGLSFIVFHSDEAKISSPGPDLGMFHLKPQDTGQRTATISAWSLMTKKKEQSVEQKGAAAVVAAIRGGDIKLPSAKNAPIVAKVTALTPEDVLDAEEETSNQSGTPARNPKTPKPRKKADEKTSSDRAPKRAPKPKDTGSPKKKVKIAAVSHFDARPKKPFNRLMEDVVFVISGFQNPLRSNIRNSALAMGAKYKADWDGSCTHLVCAFRNTPKFCQVQGRGKIMKKDWIEKCYENRKRIPWRRFALDPQDQNQPESDEEVLEDTGPSTSLDNRRRVNDSSSEDDEIEKEVRRIKNLQQNTPKPSTSPAVNRNVATSNGISSDDDSSAGLSKIRPAPTFAASASRGRATPSPVDDPPDRVTQLSIYEVETEEEASDSDGASMLNDLPRMPSYFEGCNFLLLDDIEESQRAILKRYISARLGNVISDIEELTSPSPAYCVTEDKSRLEEVKNVCANVKGVKPDWIWFCHDENKLQDVGEYAL